MAIVTSYRLNEAQEKSSLLIVVELSKLCLLLASVIQAAT